MIRKRKDIDNDIKRKKEYLEEVIEDSLRAEKECEDEIASLNNKLSELTSEICFEDTREGITKALEDTAFGKIRELLGELSKITGKTYSGMSLTKGKFLSISNFTAAEDHLITGKAGGRL